MSALNSMMGGVRDRIAARIPGDFGEQLDDALEHSEAARVRV
jgi:hypothetical protein